MGRHHHGLPRDHRAVGTPQSRHHRCRDAGGHRHHRRHHRDHHGHHAYREPSHLQTRPSAHGCCHGKPGCGSCACCGSCSNWPCDPPHRPPHQQPGPPQVPGQAQEARLPHQRRQVRQGRLGVGPGRPAPSAPAVVPLGVHREHPGPAITTQNPRQPVQAGLQHLSHSRFVQVRQALDTKSMTEVHNIIWADRLMQGGAFTLLAVGGAPCPTRVLESRVLPVNPITLKDRSMETEFVWLGEVLSWARKIHGTQGPALWDVFSDAAEVYIRRCEGLPWERPGTKRHVAKYRVRRVVAPQRVVAGYSAAASMCLRRTLSHLGRASELLRLCWAGHHSGYAASACGTSCGTRSRGTRLTTTRRWRRGCIAFRCWPTRRWDATSRQARKFRADLTTAWHRNSPLL